MQRLYGMTSKLPAMPLPGRYAKVGATGIGTAYEPYRNQDSYNPPNTQSQRATMKSYGRKNDSRFSKILRILSCLVAIALAAGIVVTAARIVVILESTADTRLMWPYGMMLKAWPPGGMLAVSTYIMLAAGAMALFVDCILLFLLCARRGDNGRSLFSSRVTLTIRAAMLAALVTAIVLDAVAKPNLRSWSCVSKEFEHDFRHNVIGFESVCFNLTTAFSAAITLAVVELLNVAIAVWTRIKQRRYPKVTVHFADAPTAYGKLDESVREDDEIPMLDVDRRGQMQ